MRRRHLPEPEGRIRVEWWQLVLIFALLVLGIGYAAYHAVGAEKFDATMKRTFAGRTPRWLHARLGWDESGDRSEGAEEQPAPVKFTPPPPPTITAADSSEAAQQQLRRIMKRTR